MFGHDIIVVGASKGGVDALPKLIGGLPNDLPAAVFIVLHIAAQGPDLLPEIIQCAASLSVAHGRHGEKIRPGRVYVAPPDHHLQVADSRVRLSRGPRENFHRPSIDTLFRTAAESYGSRVVGVVLTGNLDDGTAGLHAVKSHGGIAIVQDPKEALVPAMPQSTLRNVKMDHCLRLSEIGPVLVRLATKRTLTLEQERSASHGETNSESQGIGEEIWAAHRLHLERNGPLWEIKTGPSLQFAAIWAMPIRPTACWRIMPMVWSALSGRPCGRSMNRQPCCGGSANGSINPLPWGKTGKPRRKNTKNMPT